MPFLTFPLPYVGVTGLMSAAEVSCLLRQDVVAELVHTRRRLMIGVLVSWKTLNCLAPRAPGRYPPIGQVAGIFSPHRATMNLVHYNTSQQDLDSQLQRLMEYAGPWCDGVQLNVPWPDAGELRRWNKSESGRGKRLIIQIGTKALAEAGDESGFRTRLNRYHDLATDLLIDLSGGTGKRMNAHALRWLLIARQELPEVGLGLAGGLDAETVGGLMSFDRVCRRLSCDAESRLRHPSTDVLDVAKARDYVLTRLRSLP